MGKSHPSKKSVFRRNTWLAENNHVVQNLLGAMAGLTKSYGNLREKVEEKEKEVKEEKEEKEKIEAERKTFLEENEELRTENDKIFGRLMEQQAEISILEENLQRSQETSLNMVREVRRVKAAKKEKDNSLKAAVKELKELQEIHASCRLGAKERDGLIAEQKGKIEDLTFKTKLWDPRK